VDETNYKFFKNTVTFSFALGAIVVMFYTIPSLHNIGVTMFAGAGIFAAIVGFASQSAFSNIITGFFIVVFKPFRVHDYIQIGANYRGIVEDITIRHIVIKDMENRRIIIPNSVINSETIVNSDILDERICRAIEFNITYDTDISFASHLIQEEAMNHRFCIDGRTRAQKEAEEPVVKVRVIALGESSVKLRASVWSANNDNSFELFCDLNKAIKERFEKEGVDIAYPHRTIVNKGTAAEAATD